jgi:GxxExxY protein
MEYKNTRGCQMLHQELTKQIIGAFYAVNNRLGFGFLEKVYENSMVFELRSLGFKVEKQKSIKVY